MFRLIRSITRSAGKAIANDPEVKGLKSRHTRISAFVRRRFSREERFGLYLTIGFAISFIFVLFFFGVVEDLIGNDPLIRSDLRIINLVQILRTHDFNGAMLFITTLGRWQVVFAGIAVVGISLALWRRWRHIVALVVSVIGGEIFVWVVKHIAARPRPPLINALAPESSYSFPSGHAFVAVSFYGLLAYFLFRTVRNRLLKALIILAGIALILAIGFSRIYLGAHWPSDVLASLAAGGAWLTAVITALEITGHEYRRGRQGKPPARSSTYKIIAVVLLAAAWCGFVFAEWRTYHLNTPELTENKDVVFKKDIPETMFAMLPRTSEDITGAPMEPISLILVGSEKKVLNAFHAAGWLQADPINHARFLHLLTALAFNRPYPNAPGSPSFWNARPNDFAYEQPTAANTARERHHIHIWKTPFTVPGHGDVWFCTVHFDKAIGLESNDMIPTHRIDPAVDKEREKVKEDLLGTGLVGDVEEFQLVEPMMGSNQAGDHFFTDGRSEIIYLK